MELQLTYAFSKDEIYTEFIKVECESLCGKLYNLVEQHIEEEHGEGAVGKVVAISLLKREVESDGREEN